MNTEEITAKTKEEILKEIAELKERLNNLEKAYDAYDTLTPPNKRWRAKKGASYYYINAEGSLCADTEDNRIKDESRYIRGNYFKTISDIDFERKRSIIISDLQNWATPVNDFDWDDISQHKYLIALNWDKMELIVNYATYYQSSELYFKTEEIATKAIESVGEDNIIKYYFKQDPYCFDYKKEKEIWVGKDNMVWL